MQKTSLNLAQPTNHICNAEFALENETHKLLWEFEIQPDHLISARRPDVTLANKKENLQNCWLWSPGRH